MCLDIATSGCPRGTQNVHLKPTSMPREETTGRIRFVKKGSCSSYSDEYDDESLFFLEKYEFSSGNLGIDCPEFGAKFKLGGKFDKESMSPRIFLVVGFRVSGIDPFFAQIAQRTKYD